MVDRRIMRVRTGRMPPEALPRDEILTNGNVRMVLRRRYVKMRSLKVLVNYNGVYRPRPDEIVFTGQGKSAIPIFSQGHMVQAPILPDNIVPMATIVTFVEVLRRRRPNPPPTPIPVQQTLPVLGVFQPPQPHHQPPQPHHQPPQPHHQPPQPHHQPPHNLIIKHNPPTQAAIRRRQTMQQMAPITRLFGFRPDDAPPTASNKRKRSDDEDTVTSKRARTTVGASGGLTGTLIFAGVFVLLHHLVG